MLSYIHRHLSGFCCVHFTVFMTNVIYIIDYQFNNIIHNGLYTDMSLDILTTSPYCALLRGSYQYTEDLKKKLVLNSGARLSVVIDSCQSITTLLCLSAWTHELSQFPDRWLAGFILNGGFYYRC